MPACGTSLSPPQTSQRSASGARAHRAARRAVCGWRQLSRAPRPRRRGERLSPGPQRAHAQCRGLRWTHPLLRLAAAVELLLLAQRAPATHAAEAVEERVQVVGVRGSWTRLALCASRDDPPPRPSQSRAPADLLAAPRRDGPAGALPHCRRRSQAGGGGGELITGLTTLGAPRVTLPRRHSGREPGHLGAAHLALRRARSSARRLTCAAPSTPRTLTP